MKNYRVTAPDGRTITVREVPGRPPTEAELDAEFARLPPAVRPTALGGKVGKYHIVIEEDPR